MRYAVIGTGAIGGYYGAMFAKAGKDVHFLLHSDYGYVREHGLSVQSCNGDFHLANINAYDSTAAMPKADVVIVALKTTNNAVLRTLLPPIIHEHTAVLLIQNGIGVEEYVERMIPGIQLIAGLAFICSAKTEPGCVRHQAYGSINLGNYSCRDGETIGRMIADFTEAGITAKEVQYDEARWRKAVWNMPFNGMTVAMDTTTDRLLADTRMREVIREMMREVIEASRACGVTTIPDDFIDTMIQMTLEMVPYSPSMKLDYDFHRKMEIEYLYTRPIEIARSHGYRMVRLEMLEAELRMKENMQG